jgi:hypothetical protein
MARAARFIQETGELCWGELPAIMNSPVSAQYRVSYRHWPFASAKFAGIKGYNSGETTDPDVNITLIYKRPLDGSLVYVVITQPVTSQVLYSSGYPYDYYTLKVDINLEAVSPDDGVCLLGMSMEGAAGVFSYPLGCDFPSVALSGSEIGEPWLPGRVLKTGLSIA